MKLILFIHLTLFFLCVKCESQEYNYFHYDIKDGLSGITTYTIAQDKDGFLWFGTETGLSRFDGTYFKNYKADEGLYDNEIINLFVDSKNRVWIFPFKNSVYYYYNGKIHNASNDSLLKKFHLKNEIFKASEDKNGNISFLNLDGIYILSKDNDLKEINKINGENFYSDGCGILANGNCNIFISSLQDIANHRVNSYEYKDSQFYFKEIIHDNNLSRNTIEVNPDYTLIRNKDIFEISNPKTHEQFNVKVPNHFHTLSYIDDSCFAISTSEETFLFNINQKKITDSFLIHKTVNKCYKDNEDNFWFATMGYGVYCLSSTKFKIYTLENNSNSMSVHALNKYRNELYIGSAKILLWDLNLSDNSIKKIKIKTEYDIGRVSAIQPLNNSNLLLGTDNGIFKINGNKTTNFFQRTSVKSLFLHNDSVVLASDRNVYDIGLSNFNNVDTIWHRRATCACKADNNYYVGTLGGLYRIGNDKQHTAIALGNIYPLLKDKITAIAPIQNEALWIATENFGVIYLEKNKIKYHITTKDGLTSNVCRCLFIDKSNLWLGTDRGANKIDMSHYPFVITRFTPAEGLDCEIINCIYAQGDSVFAGTPFGVTYFNAGTIKSKSICELKLEDIQSKNSNWFYKQDTINLKSNDNFLRFDYAGISFVSLADITYYYQLKGLDDTWQSTKQNSIVFESLPAGGYEFNLFAVNKYGVRSKTISIYFTKAKTFWQLLWVQGIIVIFLVYLVWLIVKQRIKFIRRNANEKIVHERKTHELEQMALSAQMNPHFIFNSLNSIQQYIFSGNILEANQFITNFSSLIRQTLYISGKKFITVEEEIRYLESYLTIEQTKYENVFNFIIKTDDKLAIDDILIPPLILQPYIENSIRHGMLNLADRVGEIIISFYLKDDSLFCSVEDNGVGRETSGRLRQKTRAEHKSKGMELVQKRIESLNAIYNVSINITIEDIVHKNKTGTCVNIKFPLSYGEL
jgi:hypothetical protein